MSTTTQNKPQTKVILFDNSFVHPKTSDGMDFSDGKRIARHLERDGKGVAIVEDGIIDRDAEIQSQACNAGLENIKRLMAMRYGTLENAIARNKDKQVFADVSKIPLSVAEQSEYVQGIQQDVDAMCAKLGISKEDLLKCNQEFLAQKLVALNQAAAAPADSNEGGHE